MPIFPVLETEDLVQEKDKTRFSGLKSYASGTTAITAWAIKPGVAESFINVSSAKFLDWQFDFTIDIDATNNKLNFEEGGVAKTATLASGSYTLAALATEIATKLNAAGTFTYDVSVDSVNKFTIEADQEFVLLIESGANFSTSVFRHIGFIGEDTAESASHVGAKVETVEKVVSLKCTNAVPSNVTVTKTIQVVSALADNLFSTDDMLVKHEYDILKFVPNGRATFKDVHRRAQTLILAWLDTEGYEDYFGDKITKQRFLDTAEVAEWSTMMVLRLIMEGLRNAIDDVFDKKSKKYLGLEEQYRKRAILRIDLDQDGQNPEEAERLSINSGRVFRR